MEIKIDNEVYTLDIEKAKELGVISKKDTRVKSWEEYLTKHKNSPAYSYNASKGEIETFTTKPTSMEQQLTSKDAEAIWAISRLMKLRRDWVGDWNPEDNILSQRCYYAIIRVEDELFIDYLSMRGSLLTFPTSKDAKEFMTCFKDLIEMCKYYIG